MSTPKSIIKQLKSQLQDSSSLSAVNDNAIMIGDRDVEQHAHPCILLEPIRNPEEILDMGSDDVGLEHHIRIIGIVKNEKIEDCIDAMYDLETNIKKAIYGDPEVNDLAVYTYIIDTNYNREHPFGEIIIDIKVQYEQDKDART